MLAVLGRCLRVGIWRIASRSSVLALLGVCHLDMRRSTTEGDKLKMNVTVLFGSATLILPPGARVKPSGMSILARSSVDVPEEEEESEMPIFEIEWTAILGRIRIVTSLDEESEEQDQTVLAEMPPAPIGAVTPAPAPLAPGQPEAIPAMMAAQPQPAMSQPAMAQPVMAQPVMAQSAVADPMASAPAAPAAPAIEPTPPAGDLIGGAPAVGIGFADNPVLEAAPAEASSPGLLDDDPGLLDDEPALLDDEPALLDDEPALLDDIDDEPALLDDEPGLLDDEPQTAEEAVVEETLAASDEPPTAETPSTDEKPALLDEEPGLLDVESDVPEAETPVEATPALETDQAPVAEEPTPELIDDEPALLDDEPGLLDDEPALLDDGPGLLDDEPQAAIKPVVEETPAEADEPTAAETPSADEEPETPVEATPAPETNQVPVAEKSNPELIVDQLPADPLEPAPEVAEAPAADEDQALLGHESAFLDDGPGLLDDATVLTDNDAGLPETEAAAAVEAELTAEPSPASEADEEPAAEDAIPEEVVAEEAVEDPVEPATPDTDENPPTSDEQPVPADENLVEVELDELAEAVDDAPAADGPDSVEEPVVVDETDAFDEPSLNDDAAAEELAAVVAAAETDTDVDEVLAIDEEPEATAVDEPGLLDNIADSPEPADEPGLLDNIADSPEPADEPGLLDDIADSPDPMDERGLLDDIAEVEEPLEESATIEVEAAADDDAPGLLDDLIDEPQAGAPAESPVAIEAEPVLATEPPDTDRSEAELPSTTTELSDDDQEDPASDGLELVEELADGPGISLFTDDAPAVIGAPDPAEAEAGLPSEDALSDSPISDDGPGLLDEDDGPGLLEVLDNSPGLLDEVDGPGLLEADESGLLDNTDAPGLLETDEPGLLDNTDAPGLLDDADGPGFLDEVDGPGLLDQFAAEIETAANTAAESAEPDPDGLFAFGRRKDDPRLGPIDGVDEALAEDLDESGTGLDDTRSESLADYDREPEPDVDGEVNLG